MRVFGGTQVSMWTQHECVKQLKLWYLNRPRARWSPFQLLLFERGRETERAYLGIVRERATSYLDIGELPRREQADATLAAMREGVELIVHPLLSLAPIGALGDLGIQLAGEADVLRLAGNDRLASGFFPYEVVEVKSASSVKAHHQLQAAFYTYLLSRTVGADPEAAYVVTPVRDSNEAAFAEAEVALADVRPELERFLAEDLPSFVTDPEPDFHIRSDCDGCVYREGCKREAVEAQHLSVLPNIRRSQRADLHDAGVRTWPELAVERDEFTRIQARWSGTSWVLERLREQALSFAFDATLARESLREHLRAIASERGSFTGLVGEEHEPMGAWVHFDLESDPLRDEVYLFGYQVESFRRALGAGATATLDAPVQRIATNASEQELFHNFLNAMDAVRAQHDGLALLHYGRFERTQLKALARKHPEIPDVAERVERLCDESLDLHAALIATRVLPVQSYSLKAVAPCLRRITDGQHGHEWQGPTERRSLAAFLRKQGMDFATTLRNVDDVAEAAERWGLSFAEILTPSAGTSVLWHRENVAHARPVWPLLIKAYNHDDLIAARSVAYWLLHEMAREQRDARRAAAGGGR